MYLFDTDILSNMMKQSPSQNLLKCVNLTPVENQFTSSITLGELIFGARKKQSSRYMGKIEQQIERLVTNRLPILPFDIEAAYLYGEIRSKLELCGIRIEDNDIMIAAIALTKGLVVVTGNVGHFKRIPGLSVENWL